MKPKIKVSIDRDELWPVYVEEKDSAYTEEIELEEDEYVSWKWICHEFHAWNNKIEELYDAARDARMEREFGNKKEEPYVSIADGIDIYKVFRDAKINIEQKIEELMSQPKHNGVDE